MKKYEKLCKRLLACLCMFTLIATGLWTGAKQDVKADTGETVVKEWAFYNEAQTVTGTTWEDYTVNVTLPEGQRTAENLALYIKMSNIPAAAANGGEWRIKLGNYEATSQKENAAHFVPKVSTTTYEGVFMFTDLTNSSKLNLNSAIKMCRIYHSGGQVITGAIIEELKIIDITPHVEEYAGDGVSIFDQDIEVTSSVYSNAELNVTLPEVESAENLALYIKLEDVPESAANGGEWRIKLGNTSTSITNNQEGQWNPIVTAGTYEGIFYFSDMQNSNKFSITGDLATFRLYHNNSANVSIKGTKITEAKFIKTTNFLSPSMTPEEAGLDTSNVPSGYTFEGWYTDETCTTVADGTAHKLYAKFTKSVLAGMTPEEAGLDTSNVPTGYTFAGWYADSSCSSESVVDGMVYGTAYAKFVRAGIQGIRAQHALEDDGTAAIRFVTTVDSLQYKKVGFKITINGLTLPKESTVVYRYLYAVGNTTGDAITYSPTDIDAAAKYFNTYTIGDIPVDNCDFDIKVQAYWVTQDGTTVLGETSTFNLHDMMN